jgi:TolA-binding protein
LPPADPKDKLLSVVFGDSMTFRYTDARSIASPHAPRVVTVEGRVHHGSDGRMAAFTKRFKDPEMAVRTSFLTAEAMFEMAKQHRKLKQKDKAAVLVARGKRILEEAMRDYPNTTLRAQGQFLLANLAEELGDYPEAVGRYSQVIRNWPESEYASRSQFKKGLCFEKSKQFDQACEEYVKVLYIYPDSDLVSSATINLARHYHRTKQFRVAARIFFRFQQRNPAHKLAPMTLFMSAQSYMQNKDYDDAVKMFQIVVDKYTDDKRVRSEAMYWQADCLFNGGDYIKSYQTFTKLTWDYPESKWAKIARGRLTDEQLIGAGEKSLRDQD